MYIAYCFDSKQSWLLLKFIWYVYNIIASLLWNVSNRSRYSNHTFVDVIYMIKYDFAEKVIHLKYLEIIVRMDDCSIQCQRRENYQNKLVVKNNLKKEQDKYRHIIKFDLNYFWSALYTVGKNSLSTLLLLLFLTRQRKKKKLQFRNKLHSFQIFSQYVLPPVNRRLTLCMDLQDLSKSSIASGEILRQNDTSRVRSRLLYICRNRMLLSVRLSQLERFKLFKRGSRLAMASTASSVMDAHFDSTRCSRLGLAADRASTVVSVMGIMSRFK